MRVLFVNHTAAMSGAEHSMLTLISALRARDVSVEVASPAGGLADVVRGEGMAWHEIGGTDASLALHPTRTPRALAAIAADGLRIARLARSGDFDVIHANSTRSGLISSMFSTPGAPPNVIHVRDAVPPGAVSTAIFGYARARADAVICISQSVADRMPRRPARHPVHVVHNPIDVTRFDPDRYDRAAARATLGLAPGELAVGVIGQITSWKGQEEAIRVLARLRDDHPEARLLIVGSAKFASARTDNAGYAERIGRLPAELGIGDRVRLLGEHDDIPAVMRALDVLLVPSWNEPFGRVVVEGMAMKLAVIATSVGGPPEIITAGEDGLLVPPRDIAAWARALADLLADGDRRAALGRRSRATATARFTPASSGARVMNIYQCLAIR